MMNNIFVSDADKASYQTDLSNIHTVWARPFTIYRKSERVTITANPSYLGAYGANQPSAEANTNYIENSGVFLARIWYLPGLTANAEALTSSTSDRGTEIPQLRFRNDKNYVRLKLDVSGYNFINGATNIEIDRGNYNIFTAYRRHGLFTPQYWEVWLEQNS